MFKTGRKIVADKKGQGTVEYIIVAAGLMGAFLSFYVLYSHLVPKQFEQGAKIILTNYTVS
ncbi:MAG: hypothetical protein IKW71_01175 [Elusimicrobiaceae bacterium]|nr:hypothetical protein [Elusimicrobiaceae bacterium]